MNQPVNEPVASQAIDPGLSALCAIAAFYRIAADPRQIAHELALGARFATATDVARAATLVGLKTRILSGIGSRRLASTPLPAIARLKGGAFVVIGGRSPEGQYRLVDTVTRIDKFLDIDALFAAIEPEVILVARKIGGAGIDPATFGFRWFLPSIWRYRKPLGHVLIASFFVQIFALVTPLFFQVIVDKVLAHKSYSTLFVLIVGLSVCPMSS